jgi:ATP-dependent Clp protease, protease subunit
MIMLIPTIIDKTPTGERAYDIYSRLLEDRIIFIGDQIDHNMANSVIAQLLWLEKKDPKKDIIMYINSPGWSIMDGNGIYDTMQYLSCDIVTICTGLAASYGAMLLTAGTKGKRFALPHAEIMIHQPLGWSQGQATDIEINARHILRLRDTLNGMLAHHTGQTTETIAKDCERDNWMTAEQAVEYGLIDKVITKISDVA